MSRLNEFLNSDWMHTCAIQLGTWDFHQFHVKSCDLGIRLKPGRLNLVLCAHCVIFGESLTHSHLLSSRREEFHQVGKNCRIPVITIYLV